MFARGSKLRNITRVVSVWVFLGVVCSSSAFVLIGPPNPLELNPTIGGGGPGINNNLGNGNGTFGYGGPKDIKRFFRWNIPYLVYSFDASFINYFGFEGMDAVHDSFRVLNDFFVPEDGDYSGMSELNLSKHGFLGNYNTTWLNTTAQNAQIIDIKSLVLGMLVNQLGIGNSHRHAYTVTGGTQSAWGNQYNFNIRLRNYDPQSLKESDVINGVQYAYRLVHDALPQVGGGLPAVNVVDVEEYTADTSGNAWTAVSGICDAFYGETMIYWTDQPTLFDFGVYYDGVNAMGGQYQPRHALTFDDAGGLKYLYSTNTYAWETIDATDISLVYPAQFLPTTQDEMRALNANWTGVPAGLNFPNATGKRLPIWPRRGTTIPAFRYTTPILFQPVISAGATPLNSGGQNNIGPGTLVLRGGIDKMQFYHQPMDSLLGLFFVPTNFTWSFPFVAQSGYDVGGLTNTAPGASAWLGQSKFKFMSMTVGRSVTQPDFIFICDDLGVTAGDGVPIAYERPDNAQWTDNAIDNWATYLTQLGGAFNDPNYPGAGPGTINQQGVLMQFRFTKLAQDFELVWSGETTVVGDKESYYTLWGHIKGPGPNDVLTFPSDATMWRVDNLIIPDASPPVISLVSDDGGLSPIELNTYTRTEETLTIIGNEMASVTAVEILKDNLVLATVMPVDKYIKSNTRIDLPAGLLSETVEGTGLEVRVWNSVGVSERGPQKFDIETGRPVVSSTSSDGTVYDRGQPLVIRGYGFKSKDVDVARRQLKYVRIDDGSGAAIFDEGNAGGGISNGLPLPVAGIEVLDDSTAVLPVGVITSMADGSGRRLRVARTTVAKSSDVGQVLSPGSNQLIAVITTKPVITSISQMKEGVDQWEDIKDTGMFRRDGILEIKGSGLNTTTVIELVPETGNSFENPVFIQLPNAGVTVDDNGTRIVVAANSIPYSDADTNSSVGRTFRVYNAVGTNEMNSGMLFAVNIQPEITGMSAFANSGYYNRDKTVGDDVAIYGKGLKAVGEIHIIESNGSDMNSSAVPKIALPNPGVTVTDTQISLNTGVAQFSWADTADTDVNSTHRVFKFVSARSNATTPLINRFGVGVPPGLLTIGGLASADNYNREEDNMTISGSGLGMVSKIEIVDMFGVQLQGGAEVMLSTGVNVINKSLVEINASASGWAAVTSKLDHVTAFGRRIRVTTPFGVSTSNATSGGAFTVSAPAIFGNGIIDSASDTFAGGGYDAGVGPVNGTYTRAGGNLFLNGLNFRGMNNMTFYIDTATVLGGSWSIDPNNPPAGVTFASDGTRMEILNTALPTAWIGTAAGASDKRILLRSASGIERYTPHIKTQ